MILKEFLEQVNEVLKENMNKEVIKTGYNTYDTVNGRILINEYRLKDIIERLDTEDTIDYVSIRNAINLTFFDIKFKLKRKKSDIISSYDSANQLTYSEIFLDPNTPKQEQLLDIELSDIKKQYIDKMKEEERLRKEENLNKLESFKSKLVELGLNTSQFKELMVCYNNLNRYEKENFI